MSRLKTFDWSFVVVPFILSVISVATIYTITYAGVGARLAISQTVFVAIGFVLMGLFTLMDYRRVKIIAWPMFVVGLILLLPLLPFWSSRLPFVVCSFNACRWLDFKIFHFQTGESFKLLVTILFAAFLSERAGRAVWWHALIYLTILVIPVAMIAEQPDLGTAVVVLVCGLTVLLLSRFPWWLWAGLLTLALIVAPVGWQRLKSYQRQRVEVFLNPRHDLSKTGYNVRQAEIAVGSGGLFGRGFGQGSQSQLNFLPVAHTDFIFSGYAEATGYVGTTFLIGAYVFLVWRALRVAELAKDAFGRYLAVGIAAMIGVQVLVNIGMNIRLVPVTGIPLPFMSYGGTALFVAMLSVGLLQSIAIRHKKISFG